MKRFALLSVITVVVYMLLPTHISAAGPYDDNFNDNSINPVLWQKITEQGGHINEVNQRLEYTSSSTAHTEDTQGYLSSNWFIDLTQPFKAKLDFDSSGAPEASNVWSDVWLILVNPYRGPDRTDELWIANGVYNNQRSWWGCSILTDDEMEQLFTNTTTTSGTFYMWSDTPNNILVGHQDFDTPYQSFDISSWGSNAGYFDIGGWSDGTTISSGMYLDNFELVQGSVISVIPAPSAILLAGIGAGLVGWLRRRRAL